MIAVADPGSEPARSAIASYFAELEERFPSGFVGVDPADGADYRPPSGTFVLATVDGQAVGCGAVRTIGDGIGEIKRMWVHPDRRGLGLGGRLLDELEKCAGGLGCDVVRLDTNGTLAEAIALYGRRGYLAIGRYNDNPYATHFFEKSL